MMQRALNRDAFLRAQHALTEDEIRAYADRCPPEHRRAFEGWLRGTHHLDGDVVANTRAESDDAH